MPFGQAPARPAAFGGAPPPVAPPPAAAPPHYAHAVASPPAAPQYAPPPAAAPVGGFHRGPPPAARPPVAPGASLWSGVQSQEDRDPKLDLGHYRVRVISNEVTIKPDHTKKKTFKATVEVQLAGPNSIDAPGARRVYLESVSGDSAEYGLGRSKRYMVAAAGYTGDADFDAFDPQGEFINAIIGLSNQYSQAGFTIVGRLVDVTVTQGKPVLDATTKQPTGDFWRVYSWQVVPEEEQDATPRPAWAA